MKYRSGKSQLVNSGNVGSTTGNGAAGTVMEAMRRLTAKQGTYKDVPVTADQARALGIPSNAPKPQQAKPFKQPSRDHTGEIIQDAKRRIAKAKKRYE